MGLSTECLHSEDGIKDSTECEAFVWTLMFGLGSPAEAQTLQVKDVHCKNDMYILVQVTLFADWTSKLDLQLL